MNLSIGTVRRAYYLGISYTMMIPYERILIPQVPRDVELIILSYGYFCMECNTFSISPKRQCKICFPNKIVCNDCFLTTGLSHMDCLVCGHCGVQCCYVHNLYYINPFSPIPYQRIYHHPPYTPNETTVVDYEMEDV